MSVHKLEFGSVDVGLLKRQMSFLIDTNDLESDRDYNDAYEGLLSLLGAIVDYCEPPGEVNDEGN